MHLKMSVQVSALGVMHREGVEPAGCTFRELLPCAGMAKAARSAVWLSHHDVHLYPCAAESQPGVRAWLLELPG